MSEINIPPPILVFKRGTIHHDDLKRLRDAGIVAVVSTEPDAVRYIRPSLAGSNMDRIARIMFDDINKEPRMFMTKDEWDTKLLRLLLSATPEDAQQVKS